MIDKLSKTYTCPLEVSVDLISGKWKCLIMWHLRNGKLRFSQLKRRLPGITEKMLTQQLRGLERDNLLFRKVYSVIPPKVEYSLTVDGKLFIPVLKTLYDLGIDNSHRLNCIIGDYKKLV
jgi:DNA-binding HxlR family transcriptional regulator